MKKLLIIFLILISSNLYSQFSNVEGLYGGPVNAVCKYGNYLFAGTYGAGTYRSSDNGLNWEECNNGITNLQIKSVETDLNNIYCGTYGGGVFKSTDYGVSWTNLNSGFLPPFVTKITLLNNILTAITVNGIFQLINNQWTEMPFISNLANNLTSDGNYFFALGSQYLYKSTNSGLNWIQVSYPSNTNSYTSIIIKDNYVYTVCNLGVYRIHVDSLALRYYDLSLSGSYPSYICSDSNNIFVCTKNRVYQANNGGPLTVILSLTPSAGFVPASVYSKDNNLYVTTDKGILHTSLQSINWTYRNNGIRNLTLQNLSFSQNEIFGVTNNLMVYRAYPSDNQWNIFYYQQSIYYNTQIYCIGRKNASTLYMGKDYGESFLRSTNNGVSWGRPTWISLQAETYNLSFVGNNVVFSGAGLYTFNPQDTFDVQFYSVGSPVHSTYNYESGFLACSDSNGILRFKPDPVDPENFIYDTINNGLAAHKIYDVTLMGNNLFAAAVDGIYRSDKNNINWVRVFQTINNSAFFKILNINNILVICSSNYIYTSVDNGNIWILLYTARPNKPVKTMGNNSDYLYVSIGNSGLIKRPVANLIGVTLISSDIPRSYLLHQNYPNPFNPSTKISYDLPESGNVSVKIFNINGKEIAEIVNEYQAAGKYEAYFDGKNLSSGIYFYVLRSNDFVSTKKMMLVK
ncbi:MAG: T9SS type A sorting domain-containing protein [Bacteroidetes bacterium]|nr:T9SS type A sorting domain-containing protein [Bacteroidota bacterium]